ncbi:biogenesis of lysosome-related organelles complex 1 subunit 6 [Ceratitis capitata]|uniref:Biogenesis of lysosome-related organelles complex 1 subunit 6 n=1 Tax=Ceratitis capitata TaxID=7213 RepID=W8AUL4_CERCA|nr:biogenesis of lysosome-related organelles complex 1 subunit 6 [Ceratitis capitata]
MLKSSNLESIINAVEKEGQPPCATDDLQVQLSSAVNNKDFSNINQIPPLQADNTFENVNNVENDATFAANANTELPPSLANRQLTTGLLQIFEPPLSKARGQLKELIGKQNKIYIDLSTEKYRLDNAETEKLQEMMNNVKIYREKLIKIKKQMQSIYQRTKVLKKRALNVQYCKQKELQRKLYKQQQEEALIAKQTQQTKATTPLQ